MREDLNNEQISNVPFCFYKKNYRLFAWAIIALLGLAFAALVIIYYSKITQPSISYFATTSDGYLIEVTPKK